MQHYPDEFTADFETNTRHMKEAKSAVKTIEITRAVRSTKLDGLKIKKKQAIGLLDGKLIAAGDDAAEVLNNMLSGIDLDKAEVITLYYGVDTEVAEAEQVSTTIHEQYPQLQVDIVRGGQPHYNYIISIE